MNLKELAEELTTKLARAHLDRPGSEEPYDIGLYWNNNDSRPSLEQPLPDQPGLPLEEEKGAVDFVVPQQVEKLPSGK